MLFPGIWIIVPCHLLQFRIAEPPRYASCGRMICLISGTVATRL